jgi:anti-sigma factor RsiW
MNTPDCEKLDEYLAGGLVAKEAAGFEAHLAGCPACREEIGHQGRVDRLLAAARQKEPVPSSLVDRIERRIRVERRRGAFRLAWFGLSAAAIVTVAVSVWFAGRDRERPLETGPIAREQMESVAGTDGVALRPDAAPAPDRAPVDSPRVRVSLADPSEGILVPLESSHPNVSIVWVYPAVKPARGASPPAAAPLENP